MSDNVTSQSGDIYVLPEIQKNEIEEWKERNAYHNDEPSVAMVQIAIRDLDIKNPMMRFAIAIRTANLFKGEWNGRFQDLKASSDLRGLLNNFFDLAISASSAEGGQL